MNQAIDLHKRSVYAFVVLHYLRDDLTKACVDSVLGLQDDAHEVFVVIIDNHSANGSFERLEQIYAQHSNVALHGNEANLGFSAANDIAYGLVLERCAPCVVTFLNNDTCIEQRDFLQVLDGIVEENRYYVVSPDIYNPATGEHQNPLRKRPFTREQILERKEFHERRARGERSKKSAKRAFKDGLKKLPGFSLLAKQRRSQRAQERAAYLRQPHENVVFQGSALIFTDRFIETGQLPFEPKTFLYYEEEILAQRCQKNGWPTLYTPKLEVLHYHGIATTEALPDKEARDRFEGRHFADSLEIVLSYHDELYGGGEAGTRA